MLPRFERYRPLFAAFEAGGFALHLVGGCVRDAIMGAEDAGDVDFTTSALPEEIKCVLKEAGFKVFLFGERFGTVATLVDGVNVEITTYRVAERYSSGSRHPDVEFGDNLEADLGRRDLSINAMAMGADGELIDPFGGREAIGAKVLRVPGGGYDKTISILRDDPLRLLRIARFAARFSFAPSADTTEAARATSGELLGISCERWKMEMDKLLIAPHADLGLAWLADVGALGVILPETAALGSMAPGGGACARIAGAPARKDVRWAVLLLSSMMSEVGVEAMAEGVVLDDWPSRARREQVAADIGARFRLSRREKSRLVALMVLSLDRAALSRGWTRPELRRWFLEFGDATELQIDVAAALGDFAAEHVERCESLRADLSSLLESEDPRPRLPHGFGRHVRGRLGLSGEAVGRAIQRVRDAIIEGELPNGAEAARYLAWLESTASGALSS